METALRVLTAITEHRNPEPADLEELHRLLPNRPELSDDELACEVIKRALRQRSKVRARRANG